MKYLIIIIVLIIIFVYFGNSDIAENFDNSEAIQNLSSMYNNNKLTTSNLNVTGGITTQDLTTKGTLTLAGTLQTPTSNITATPDGILTARDVNVTENGNVNGNWVTNVLSARMIQPSPTSPAQGITINAAANPLVLTGKTITIGDGKSDVIIKNNKMYSVTGNSTNGDIYSFNSTSKTAPDDAYVACRSYAPCSMVTTDNNGNYWLKTANDPRFIVGSFNWPDDITFSTNINDVPNGVSGASAQTLDQCKTLTKGNKKTNWLWSPTYNGGYCANWNNDDTFWGSNYTSYFVKK
jgi:hypothetical protein